jgi:CD63 antigen
VLTESFLFNQIGAAIAVYMFRADAHSIITAKMKEGMTNYDNGTDFKGVTDTWNAVQSDFQCCGVTQYTDWKNTTFSERVKGVPDSCCKIEARQKTTQLKLINVLQLCFSF